MTFLDFSERSNLVQDKMKEFSIKITESVQSTIQRILSLNLEIESVGLLFGRNSEKFALIIDFVEMENLESSSSRFSIDYSLMIQYINSYEKKDKNLVGFFHSHPKNTEAYPSSRDMQFMIYWPFPYIWLIGTNLGNLSAFVYKNNKIYQLEISS